MDKIIKRVQLLLDNGCKIIKILAESPFTRYILVPILLSLIPTVIIIYYSSDIPKQWIEVHFPEIGIFLNKNVWLFWICIILPPMLSTLWQFFSRIILSEEGCNAKEAVAFLNMLEHGIIGNKIIHLGNIYKKIPKSKKPTKKFGIDIAINSNEQIDRLIQGLYYYFQSVYVVGKYRTALAKMDKNLYVEQIVCFYPKDEGPRSSIQSLKVDHCGFTIAAKTKRLHIVSDIKKEGMRKKNFVITDESRKEEEGSIICFPVILRNVNEVPYVISVSVDIPHFFTKKRKKVCEFILSKIANRIIIEHFLSVIKEKCNV